MSLHTNGSAGLGNRSARLATILVLACAATTVASAEDPWLRDRGPGIPTSLFGTYIEDGQIMIYPFYEYVLNKEEEYKGEELGFNGTKDYLGRLEQHETLLFFGFGLSERFLLEVEGAVWTKATLEKAADDTTNVPDEIEESGLGDVESQLRWMWRKETEDKPAYYSFAEVVFPIQDEEVLIGTTEWEYGVGFGFIKGWDWGTLNGRISVVYDSEDNKMDLGEYALEYLRRTSDHWRWVGTIEVESDEVNLIGEIQWHVNPNVFFKFNSGFGVTEKAEDVAPEVGVVFIL